MRGGREASGLGGADLPLVATWTGGPSRRQRGGRRQWTRVGGDCHPNRLAWLDGDAVGPCGAPTVAALQALPFPGRDHQPRGLAVLPLPAQLSGRRGAPGRAGDRGELGNHPPLVPPIWADVRRRPPPAPPQTGGQVASGRGAAQDQRAEVLALAGGRSGGGGARRPRAAATQPGGGRGDRSGPGQRRPQLRGAVGPGLVVVVGVLAEHAQRVALARDQEPVRALAAGGAHPVPPGARRTRRRRRPPGAPAPPGRPGRTRAAGGPAPRQSSRLVLARADGDLADLTERAATRARREYTTTPGRRARPRPPRAAGCRSRAGARSP
jgi:hypothetical protein